MSSAEARRRFEEALEFQRSFDTRLAELDEMSHFDDEHGVETSRPVEVWEMEETDDSTIQTNSRYSPSPIRTIRLVLAACAVEHERISFVDFGSGKGRVLLAAMEYPFRRVIGIEFSGQLCNTARLNLQRSLSKTRKCSSFEIHHLDAREFEIPADAGLFYFYEPFAAEVAEEVLHRIEHSIRANPRPTTLCFVGSHLLPAVERHRHWLRLSQSLVSPDNNWYDTQIYVSDG